MARVFKKLGEVKISEFEHCGRKRKNYTLQSVKRLKRKYPGYEICLLIGGDMLESFSSWSRFRRVLSETLLVVAARETEDTKLLAAAGQMERDGGRVMLLRFEPLVISSSGLREMIRESEDVSEYVEEDTLRYIKKHGLYRGGEKGGT